MKHKKSRGISFQACYIIVTICISLRNVDAFSSPNKSVNFGRNLVSAEETQTQAKEVDAKSKSKKQQKKLNLVIRTTQDSDIAPIASFLSDAIASPSKQKNAVENKNVFSSLSMNNWKNKLDQLWAKADIESLLRQRMLAVQLGKNAYNKLSETEYNEWERLQLLWYNNEKLRAVIAQASTSTGEDNIWLHHQPLHLTPESMSWLNHLQMTAVNAETGEVVGFCEVAMLSNPLYNSNEQTQQENDDEECSVDDDECIVVLERKNNVNNHDKSNSQQVAFSPAITNLATAPKWRRCGVGTRLLQGAERYIAQHWESTSIGLYVEQDNEAALGLYKNLGYEPKVACDGGGRLGDMWYMTKDLSTKRTGQEERMPQAQIKESVA